MCLLSRKKNASERINLQDIMQLRTQFLKADDDGSGELELPEFISNFGKVLGKNLSYKELNQLFMRIDADSNASVDWNEFMNYMLIENATRSLMKQEQFSYIRPVGLEHDDAPPSEFHKAHSSKGNITAMIIIKPQDMMQESARGLQP